MRLCLSPVDWAVPRRWWIAVRTLEPQCPDARSAFGLYRGAAHWSHLVFDSWEAVRLFAGVYRDLVRGVAEPALGGAAAALASLPNIRAGHPAGAQLVYDETGRVVFLEEPQRVAHRRALAAACWEAEMLSWRSLGRCTPLRSLQERRSRHDLRSRLDRQLTPFRFYALFEAYTLCPRCGLRNAQQTFGWPAPTSLGASGFLAAPPAAGVFLLCRMHTNKGRHEYAVPDLFAESPVPGSDRRRWSFWPRFNAARGVFEELVTEENRYWPTFLDFDKDERRAMRVIAVFCDTREDCVCLRPRL